MRAPACGTKVCHGAVHQINCLGEHPLRADAVDSGYRARTSLTTKEAHNVEFLSYLSFDFISIGSSNLGGLPGCVSGAFPAGWN
jgi:hypothetical protein